MPKPDWTWLRGRLWERSGGLCEVSGRPLDPETFDAHHRRQKGMGGTSRPDRDWLTNLLATDPQVHNGGPQSVHGNPRWSRSNGYLVRKNVQWAGGVPVLIRGRWVLLGDQGGMIDIRDIPAGLRPDLPEKA
jgi:hypothetical protein